MYVVGAYIAYLLITIAVTVWVAHTLHKNGRMFLMEVFGGDTTLANSTARLLVVGFTLVGLGFVGFTAHPTTYYLNHPSPIMELLNLAGGVVLVLGIALSFHLLLLSRMRRRTRATLSGLPTPAPLAQP